MNKSIRNMCVVGMLALAGASVALAEKSADGPREGGAGPGGRPPAGFHLLPRHVMENLDLTDEQDDQVRALEQETKRKLYEILTPEQRKLVDQARPPRRPPGGEGPDGKQGERPPRGEGNVGGGGGDRPERGERGARPDRDR